MPAPDPSPLAVIEEALCDADSLLSLVYHRFRSRLPDDLAKDIERSYLKARSALAALARMREGAVRMVSLGRWPEVDEVIPLPPDSEEVKR